MSEQIFDDVSPAVEVVVPAIGAQLRQAREAMGLQVAQVATRLNIAGRYISALESDDFAALPGNAFVRGYLRSYARLLDLDADALVAALNRQQGEPVQPAIHSINKVRRQASSSDPLVRGGGLVLLLALIGVSIWWWQAQLAPTPSPAVLNQAAPPPEERAVPAVTTASAVVEPGAETKDESAPEAAPEPPLATNEEEPVYLSDAEVERLAKQLDQEAAVEAEPEALSGDPGAASSTVDSAQSEPGAAAMVLLEVQFSGECWVTLKDVSGTTRIARIFKAGDRLSSEVAAPAQLLLGNVSAVESAQLNGAPLSLATHTRQNIARLTLGGE